jgi:hypothetical protein
MEGHGVAVLFSAARAAKYWERLTIAYGRADGSVLYFTTSARVTSFHFRLATLSVDVLAATTHAGVGWTMSPEQATSATPAAIAAALRRVLVRV